MDGVLQLLTTHNPIASQLNPIAHSLNKWLHGNISLYINPKKNTLSITDMNYRLVSLISFLSKALERAVYNSQNLFLSQNSLLAVTEELHAAEQLKCLRF